MRGSDAEKGEDEHVVQPTARMHTSTARRVQGSEYFEAEKVCAWRHGKRGPGTGRLESCIASPPSLVSRQVTSRRAALARWQTAAVSLLTHLLERDGREMTSIEHLHSLLGYSQPPNLLI